MSEVMRFELKLNRQEVELADPETGKSRLYYIKELDGAERDSYLNDVAKRITVDRSGKGAIKNFDKFQTSLLSKCFYSSESDMLVPASEIQKFPARVVSALFKAAQDLSGLDLEKDGEDDEKND